MYPLISIVFTSYNHIRFLKKSLESLLEQTYPNFEIILVDDCSNDGSQELLKNYSADNRIKLFLKNENSGSYVYSSNFGASQAKGEFLLFSQCDDYSEPILLEKLFNGLSFNKDTCVAFCCSTLIDENNRIIATDYAGREKKFKTQCGSDTLITGIQMIRYLSKACVIPNLSAALIRKDLFWQVGGFSDKYKVVADLDFWLKTASLTNFYYVSRSLNNFRQHVGTIRSSIKIQIQILEIFSVMYNFLSDYKTSAFERFVFKTRIFVTWLYYIPVSPIVWFKSFFNVFYKVCSIDSFTPLYLFLASIIVFTNFLFRKFLKLINP